MFTEIEAKLKVESFEEVVSKLEENNGLFEAEQLQNDHYFDDHDRTLTKTDNCLRIRQQVSQGRETIFLTYKGPKAATSLKQRDEIQIKIDDFEAGMKMLESLGYERVLFFQKRRQLWLLGPCRVSLDELPVIGTFVEIEGPGEEEIHVVQGRLGLSGASHIAKSYAEMICEAASLEGLGLTEFYIEP
ncbi:MAG: class IV adenylate cyclase [Planctomycetota bacterium]